MKSTTLESKKTQKVPFFINRNYALLFSGYAVSITGDVVFSTTLVLWVTLVIAKGQSWAPLAQGGVLLATLLPTLLFGSFAGVFVDRWVKRTTMLRMDMLRAILIVFLLPFSGFFPGFPAMPAIAKLTIIYTVIFLTSTCAQFFNPSSFALIGDIIPDDHRARATGLEQSMSGMAYILAPLIAVPIFISLGPQVAIAFNALSFIVSFLLVLAMRPPQSTVSVTEEQQTNFLREYVEGVTFMLNNKVLRVILVGAFLAVVPEGALNALGIFFYQNNLRAPMNLYGLVGSAAGVGGIAGALLAALFAQRLGVRRVFSGALLLAGLVTLLYSRTASLPVALVCVFLIDLLIASVNVAVGPIVLSVSPKEMLGRIAATATSTLSMSSLLSIAILSSLSSTVLAHLNIHVLGVTLGTYDFIFALTGIIAMLGGLFAVSYLWAGKDPMPETDEHE